MNESPDESTFRALHRLVEHYTPDGTLGRTLLGGIALFLAPILFLGGSSILVGGTYYVPVALFGLISVALSVPALFIGIITLWPVYLSLIGNVESPAAYPDGASEPRKGGSPEDVLKRRYAAGELSREEFERRLDDVMATDGRGRERSEADDDDRRTRGERSRSRVERSRSR